ncbi:MAG: cupin domain-containing protein [Pseudomonadota bacterium]
MKVTRASDWPMRRANPSYFTGTVWQVPINDAPSPARLVALRVTFEPGARTHWHTHPLGQTLYVTDGVGLVQREGEQVQQIRAGDTVWIAPDEKHWHGASADHGMTHVAMQEALDEVSVVWAEAVDDAAYRGT